MLDVQWGSFGEQKHNAVRWLISLNISQCAPLPEVFWRFCSELTNLSPSFALDCEQNVVTMLGCYFSMWGINCDILTGWSAGWLAARKALLAFEDVDVCQWLSMLTLETLSAAAATRKAYKAEESVEEEDESEEEDSDEESAHEHVPKTSSRSLSSRSSSNRRSGKSSGGSSWTNNKSASRSTRYSSDYYEEAPIQRSRRPPSDLSVSGKDDALLQVTLLLRPFVARDVCKDWLLWRTCVKTACCEWCV